jgi:hypothetical protein
MIIIDDIKQGTPEWDQLRIGIPTASNFEKIITTSGEPSKQRQKYLYKLAGEILSGEIGPSYISYAMQLGIERENESRLLYELTNNVEVRQVGFVYLDAQGKVGCSPDGLVDPFGGFESKNAEPHIQIERHEKGWSKADHFQQVMGCMWVCQREWWDLQSYSRGIRPIIIRFHRDEKFIDKLAQAIISFNQELDELVNKLK